MTIINSPNTYFSETYFDEYLDIIVLISRGHFELVD